MKILYIFALLATAGVQSQNWNASLNDALLQARNSNKKVLLYFSVPEYCKTCQDLENNVLNTPEFTAFASSRFILVREDFEAISSPAEKAEKLLIVEKYNKDGFFPLLVILKNDGKSLGNAGTYNGEDVMTMLKKLESI